MYSKQIIKLKLYFFIFSLSYVITSKKTVYSKSWSFFNIFIFSKYKSDLMAGVHHSYAFLQNRRRAFAVMQVDLDNG